MCRMAAPVFLDILIATSSKIWSRFWLRGDLSKNLYGVREFPFAYTLNIHFRWVIDLLPVQFPVLTYMTFFWFKSLNSWNRLWATTGLSAFWKMLFRWSFISYMRWRKNDESYWLHRCWWRMLETKCVGDNLMMLVTVLAISVTKILYLLTLAAGTNIQKMSPRS